MKKGINAWCFSDELTLEQIFKSASENGYDGIEINMSEKDDKNTDQLRLTTDTDENGYQKITEISKKYNLPISSISTSLHWKYSLVSEAKDDRDKGKSVVRRMLDAASYFGCDTILVVPGVVRKDIPYDIAYTRAFQALNELKEYAEAKKVTIGIENVWNKFLLSPLEFRDFLDKINSPYVKAYFDAGNILLYGFPEQWVNILGPRIAKVHIKDFDTSIGNIHGFKNLLHGSMDWKMLIDALKHVGYDSYITPELSPYEHNPNQLIQDTSRALDYILGL